MRLNTWRVILGVLTVLVVLVIVGTRSSKGEYILYPDSAHPVAPLVSVQGGHNPRNGGAIYYVDVRIRYAMLFERWFGPIQQGSTMYPAEEVNGPGVSNSESNTIGAEDMAMSEQYAAAVALRADGRKVQITPSGAVVAEIGAGYPADGKLFPDDVITAVDGKRVRLVANFERVMARKRPGDPVVFTVLRRVKNKIEKKTVDLTTIADPQDKKHAVVGIAITQADHTKLPIRVKINAGDVGGPSAGLAFALEVLDKLGRNVDHGYKVAATGTISLNGAVGPIGGIKQKTIGARKTGVDVFLVPAGDNAADARKYADGLRIIPVKSFQQALHALATLPPKP
jgi:PDZ domain-containing protein